MSRAGQLDAEPMLRPLVKEFGINQVWRASIELIGHPPTWNLNVMEILKLKRFLQGTQR